MTNTVIVVGGDGFCGWPTSLYLSANDYDVIIVDNFSRRTIANQLGAESLTPIKEMSKRIAAWTRFTRKQIKFVRLDVSKQPQELYNLIKDTKPKAIVHLGEQRAAPYSMRSLNMKQYTVDNNLTGTHNILSIIAEVSPDTHFVHLGTMGVYGYGTAGLEIPEGYLDIKVDTPEGLKQLQIIYPSNAGSIYHMTKAQEQLFFQFYAKNDKIAITDLHQGIVWGTQTEETFMDEALINRFDYDGDYGTVLNRFLVQAAVGHPLTVHGTGGQTRAFIHITDTVKCIRMAIENPPQRGDRVFIRNQMAETHRVRDLAQLVAMETGATINFVDNPRNEAADNELVVSNKSFLDQGLNPVLLNVGLTYEVFNIAKKYAHLCDKTKIPCTSLWSKRDA